ncbi:MAG: type I glyceraldehyde-3-phosphate dehydrogenase [Gammaproteobacteria bacterium]|nr:MAG: type I glyceraldehyde-3-phosphate dehydrogenase [Gammaproteobacteria bacterium]
MTIKVAINGFGRIGRNVVRALYESDKRSEIEIIAINGRGEPQAKTHLFKYDSAHGRFPGEVFCDGESIIINGDKIMMLYDRDPANLRWGDMEIDIVLECTGAFRDYESASKHINAGAKQVLISAPGTEMDATIVFGVNHDILEKSHKIVSNASCTTNCLAPLVKPLHESIGIKHGSMTTIHSYTNDQVLTDAFHNDPRRARSATMSQVPTKTGAAKGLGLVLPELDGRLDGFSMRVPTVNVSAVDLSFVPEKNTNIDEINQIMLNASKNELKDILGYCDEPLVSIDFNHHSASGIYDSTLTKVMQGSFVKVIAWYDNEWGFSHRMLDTAIAMAKTQ